MSAGLTRWCAVAVLSWGGGAGAAVAQSTSQPASPANGEIQGIVYDSLLTKGPLGGATVYVVGSTITAATDARGRFTLAGVPDGDQTITFAHPKFDSAGVQAPQVHVHVAAPNKARVAIATPMGATLVRGSCPGTRAEQTGLLLGVVRDVDSGSSLPGARVVSRWFEMTIDKTGPHYETIEVSTVADPAGVFRLCGVPADIPVLVRATSDRQQSGRVEVYFNGSDVAFRDFAISLADTAARVVPDSMLEGTSDSNAVVVPRGTATLRGTVTDQNGRPLADVTIGLLDRPRSVRSDAEGHFTLAGVPAGTQTLELRAIGFAPARRVVVLRSGASAERAVSLDRAAQTLASVRVLGDRSGSRTRSGFGDRRRRGLGHFIDADEVRRRGGIYLGDVLRAVPGVVPMYTTGGRIFTMRSTSSGDRCSPTYFLDGMRWYPLDNNPILELERFIPLPDLDAVEVYSSSGTTPVQFDGGNGCGSVVFWTKR